MSEVKTLTISGSSSVNNGQYVRIEEYAAIKAESDALAAENAALKDINAWCHTEAFQNMHREFKTAEAIGCPDVDCMHDAMLVAIMHAPKTPATDAYLNSVRAEGVEMAVNELKELAQRSKSEAPKAAEHTHAAALYLMLIAAQLRAGEPS